MTESKFFVNLKISSPIKFIVFLLYIFMHSMYLVDRPRSDVNIRRKKNTPADYVNKNVFPVH